MVRKIRILIAKPKRTGVYTGFKWSKDARLAFNSTIIDSIQSALKTGQDVARTSKMRITPSSITSMMNLQFVPGEVCDEAAQREKLRLVSRAAVYRQLKLFFPHNGINKITTTAMSQIADVLAERLAIAAHNHTLVAKRTIITEEDVHAGSHSDSAICTLTAGRALSNVVPALTRHKNGMNYEMCGQASSIGGI
jgi:hypothetical protein